MIEYHVSEHWHKAELTIKLNVPEESFNRFASTVFETAQYFVNDLGSEFGTVGHVAVVKYEREK